MDAVLAVSEIFGPTLQGEGASLGAAAAFVRTAGCHVRCCWCDTRYSWDPHPPWPVPARMSVSAALAELAAALPGAGRRLVVVTGGEPLEQRDVLAELLARARAELGVDCVEVETSGTVAPGALAEVVDQFTVSPKLANADVPERVRLRWPVLQEFAAMPASVFKFVVAVRGELDEVAAVADRLGLSAVTVMPEGTNAEALRVLMRDLAPELARRGWRLSPRLHIDLWGDVPGR